MQVVGRGDREVLRFRAVEGRRATRGGGVLHHRRHDEEVRVVRAVGLEAVVGVASQQRGARSLSARSGGLVADAEQQLWVVT